jgi:hypothetical protein
MSSVPASRETPLAEWRALLTAALMLALLAGPAHCALHQSEHHDDGDSSDNCVVCVYAHSLAVLNGDDMPVVVEAALAEIAPSLPVSDYQSCFLFTLRPRPPPTIDNRL